MQPNKGTRKIMAKRRGNALGFMFFRVVLKLFGLQVTYGILYFICLHYLLFDRQAAHGALAYIKRRFPNSRYLRSQLHVYRLFISQGKQLIDRYAAISGNVHFDINVEGAEQLAKLSHSRKEGFLLLTAHVGNWQFALTTLQNMDRTVHLVMRPEDNPAVERTLNITKEGDYIRIISSEAEHDGIIRIMHALKKGDIVSIMGDRKYSFKALRVSFLNDNAHFPYGAFAIAAATNCPIVILLSAKLSYRKYLVDVRNILYPRYDGGIYKQEQLHNYVQKYASVLEEYIQKYPYQCFLFHDIWNNCNYSGDIPGRTVA